MKISIITATYNSGATVRDTIRSVLSQSYPYWEHIIVDGNSNDDTLEIIREAESRYEGRLRWVSEPDRGIYDAMNKGISMATGDVIGILNSDDFFTSEDILEKVAQEMEANLGLDAVFGDIHFVNDADLTKCVRYYSSRFFYRWMMLLGYQPAHPSFYCRKLVYDRFGTFDINFRVASDFENLLRLIYINRIKTRYLPLDFVTMRTGGASTNGLRGYRNIMADHHNAYKKNNLKSAYVLDFLRYPLKIVEVLKSRAFQNFH